MPTKLNSAGKQQPYVPAGYGDASGEYAEHETGSNKHYADASDTSKQLPYNNDKEKSYQEVKNDVIKKETEKKSVPDEMKSKDFTYNFSKEVNISSKSLNKDEIGEFNNQLNELFTSYPEIDKFRNIVVKNNTKSNTGGYIRTTQNYFSGEKTYELYINSGWLEYKDKKEEYKKEKEYFENKIKEIENDPTYSIRDKDFFKRAWQENVDYYNKKIQSDEYGNVIERVKDRTSRLKSLMAHELMHRITQTFDNYNTNKYAGDIEKNNSLNNRWREIRTNIRDVYNKALENGDAKKISKYATTSREEFISEANSMIEGNFEMPEYITNLINDIKTFVRSEK